METALKIAHLTPSFFSKDSYIGGGERYVYNVCSANLLASQELGRTLQQTIITIGPDARQFLHKEIPVVVLPSVSPLDGFMNPVSSYLWDALKGYDLVHVHQSLTVFGAFCVAVAKSIGITVITTDLGGGNEECMLAGKGLELSDGVLSISRYAESLIDSNFTGLKRVVIGPIDTDIFKPGVGVERARDQVLCVNRILPHKGIDRILEALPQDLNLTVVGQVYDKKYFDLLQKLAKGKNVTFDSDADDPKLVNLYQHSGLFVQASTHVDCYGNKILKPELMGLTTLEAMSCGIPVVVSDAGSLPELVHSPSVGRVFSDRSDLEAIFAEYVLGSWPIGNQPSLSRESAVSRYSFSSVGHQILGFYLEVLDNPKGTHASHR